MSRFAILHAIQKLDPERDHQRIVFLSACYDFPFDTTRALEFALFRTIVCRAFRRYWTKRANFNNARKSATTIRT
jgi:hypothetical protein